MQKNPFVNKTSYYNHESEYWYPDYNYILVQPRQKTRIYFPRQTKRHRTRHGKMVLFHKRKPRKPRVIVIKQKPKHKKKHHKKHPKR